jgi:hypothetical protein
MKAKLLSEATQISLASVVGRYNLVKVSYFQIN